MPGDLRHTWASWHRQAGTSCDELKDLGGWKSRNMVDQYANFATENLRSRQQGSSAANMREHVIRLARLRHGQK
jgi:integrase